MKSEKKKMISLEVSSELKEKLRVAAFKKSMSISALIREVLENQFKTVVETNEEVNYND